MMTEHSSLEYLPIADLVQGARQETALFLRKLPTDGSHAFELFRRALVLRDDAAWSGLYDQYTFLVKSWILRRASTHFIDDVDGLVNAVFAKFFHAVNACNWQNFRDTRAVLAYLRCCAESVVADDRRLRQRWSREDPLDVMEQELQFDDPAEVVATQLVAQDFWHVVSNAVSGYKERLVLQLIALGDQPRELQQRYPLLFPSVNDVYRVRRNLLERLRRNRAVQAFVRQRDT